MCRLWWLLKCLKWLYLLFLYFLILCIQTYPITWHSLTPTVQVNSVKSLSRVRLFGTPWIAAHQAFLSVTNSPSLLKFVPVESVMPSKHFILCRPLLLPPSIFPSMRVFSNESALCIRWPNYWSFSFKISPSNEYSGFRIDWMDLFAVQPTLKSFLQHHSSKSSIPQCSRFLYNPTLTSINYYWKNNSLD